MADVKIVVSMDSKAATEAAKRLDDEVRKLGGGAGAAGKEAGILGGKISGLLPTFTAASIAADVIRSGFHLLKNELKTTIAAAIEAENVDRALESALQITGQAAGGAAKHFKDYASALQKKTVYDDEAIKSAQALMIQMGLSVSVMDEATRATVGLASVFHMDLEAAARAVAQGFEGNYRTLGMLIPQVRTATTDAEKHAAMIQGLADYYGRATAEVGTFGGQLKQAKSAWGELKETIGKVVTESGIVNGFLKDTTAYLQSLDTASKENVLSWKNLVAAWAGTGPSISGAIAAAGAAAAEGAKIALDGLGGISRYFLGMRNLAIEPIPVIVDLTTKFKLLNTEIDAMPWGRHRAEMELARQQLYEITTVIEGQLPAVDKLSKHYLILAKAAGLMDPLKWEEMLAGVQRYSETAGAALGGLDAIIQQGSANRMIALDNEYSKRLALINKTIKDEDKRQQAIAALDDEFAAKRKKAAHALALSTKALAISNAIISTHEAAAKAMAQGGFILGIPWATIIEALGWIQVGLIAAQPIPLAKGGYFKRETVLAGRDADYRLADNAGHEEIVSPVPMMRSIVREELTRLVPAMAGSFTLMGGIHIHTDRQVDGATIFRELEQKARIRGFRLGRQ